MNVEDVFDIHRDLIDELVGERTPIDMIVERIREEEDLSDAEARELHDIIVSR